MLIHCLCLDITYTIFRILNNPEKCFITPILHKDLLASKWSRQDVKPDLSYAQISTPCDIMVSLEGKYSKISFYWINGVVLLFKSCLASVIKI